MKQNDKAKCIIAAMLASLVTVSGGVTTVAFASADNEFNLLSTLREKISTTEIKQNISSSGSSATAYIPSNTFVYTDNDDGTITIYGGYDMDDNLVIPTHLNGKKVTAIGKWAFHKYDNITSIVIPNTVTTIHDYAFKDCTSLKSITIPKSVKTIGDDVFLNTPWYENQVAKGKLVVAGQVVVDGQGCSGAVTIPDGTTSIAYSAFSSNEKITSVTVPGSLRHIDPYTFTHCSNLKTVTIKKGVSSVGAYAFYCCYNLTNITIPDSVTEIGENAFSNCEKLSSVTIPNSVTKIGESAFDSCLSLEKITIPDSVTEIGKYAFVNCSNLGSAMLSKNLKKVEESTFSGCETLGKIVIPEKVTSIGRSAFQGCYELGSVTIPNSVTSIGKYAFGWCYALNNISLPDNLQKIEDGTFYYCNNLKSVVLPKNLTSIGAEAFIACNKLDNVTFPPKITNIENGAFKSCHKLKTVTFEGNLPKVGSDSFSNTSFKAYYPEIWENVPSETWGGSEGIWWARIPVTPPEKVSGLIVSKSTINEITLSWDDVTDAMSYIVYRWDKDTEQWVQQTETTALTYTDTKLNTGTEYKYAVKACKTICEKNYFSDFSELNAATNPAKLTGFKATETTANAVTLKWDKVSGATGYLVYRKNDAGKWSQIADVSSLTYTDTGLKPSTTYEYAAKAYIKVDGKVYNGAYPTLKVTTQWEPVKMTDVTVSPIMVQLYTGKVIEPSLTIKDGNKTLIEGTDYTLTYKDNVNIGTATVIITGKDNYAGTTTTTFKIAEEITAATANKNNLNMYRLYNPNSGEHFYTGSITEGNNLVAAGWIYEGVAWNAPTKTGDNVYRLYNPNNGDHHYTMSADERDMLVDVGWIYEGVAWNSIPSNHEDAMPMYRLYNPNADCGSHHYTGSTEERDMLVSVGWIYEGIGWFGMTK